MLKRAGDKMALERIVIKKGAFQDLGGSSGGKEVCYFVLLCMKLNLFRCLCSIEACSIQCSPDLDG